MYGILIHFINIGLWIEHFNKCTIEKYSVGYKKKTLVSWCKRSTLPTNIAIYKSYLSFYQATPSQTKIKQKAERGHAVGQRCLKIFLCLKITLTKLSTNSHLHKANYEHELKIEPVHSCYNLYARRPCRCESALSVGRSSICRAALSYKLVDLFNTVHWCCNSKFHQITF